MQASAIQNGTIMQGEYVLLEPIPGYAGEVVQGRSRRDGRLVTIRLWRGHTAISPERVLEKPQVAGRLQHPMLASVETCGRESDGSWFIVSEHVAGKPLHEWADEVGIPPLSSVVDFVHRICQGLNAAHREGLSHDSLDPRNVVVIQQEAGVKQRLGGKILEIGVPAFMHAFPPSLLAAQFMAPEQLASCLRADGVPLNADPRMNVYSVGCLLYYLCTGGAPFPSRGLDELAQAHLEGKLVPPSKINPQLSTSLETVILRALALQRSERYVNVPELAGALTRVRLSSSASGVRPRNDSSGGMPASEPAHPKAAPATAFDERPTSESRLPSDWPVKTLSAPPPSGESTGPEVIASNRHTLPAAARGSVPVRDSWITPAGSFSSAPPLAGQSAPPQAVHAAAARAFSSSRAPSRSSSLPASRTSAPDSLAEMTSAAPPPTPWLTEESVAPDALDSPDAPVAFAEEDPTGIHLAAPSEYDDDFAIVGERRLGSKFWLAVAALAACCAGAYLVTQYRDSQASAIVLPLANPTPPVASPAAPPAERQPIGRVDPAALPTGAQTPDQLEINAPTEPDDSDERMAKPSAGPAHNTRTRRPALRAGSPPHRAAPGRRDDTEAQAEAGAPRPVVERTVPEERNAEAPPAPPREAPEAAPAAVVAEREAERQAPYPGRSTSPAPPPATTARSPQPATPLRATTQIDAVLVRGSLATSVVSRAVERIRPQLAACYARAASAVGRNGFGTVSVEIQVDERGRAQNPRATGGGLPGLAACVAEVAGKLVSDRPPDTGMVKASWKVVFVP